MRQAVDYTSDSNTVEIKYKSYLCTGLLQSKAESIASSLNEPLACSTHCRKHLKVEALHPTKDNKNEFKPE